MLEAGSTLGSYRIVRSLGRGGMADVYEAEDTRLGRHVALKILPPELARNAQLVARFEKEVRASALLNHRSIVTVFDVGAADNCHYYTMRLLTGGDLRSFIDKGLSEEEALAILRELADAFAHAHSRGFVHRDMKPENVIFDEQGFPVLTDFGIAKALDRGTDQQMTLAGVALGTPRYISPEQARGKPVDQRTDLYSLGVVFYEMLTGKPPYDGDALGVIFKHATDPIPRLPAKLAHLQPIVDGLMAKDPEQRIASGEALMQMIDALPSKSAEDFLKTVETSALPKLLKVSPVRPAELQTPAAGIPLDAAAERAQLVARKQAEYAEKARLKKEQEARDAAARAQAEAQQAASEREAQAARAAAEAQRQQTEAARKAAAEQQARAEAEQQARAQAERAAQEAAEAQRREQAARAERQRLEEEQRRQREAEAQRLAQERDAEARRQEEARAAAERQRQDEAQRRQREQAAQQAEAERRAAAERQRQEQQETERRVAAEREAQRAAEQRRAQEEAQRLEQQRAAERQRQQEAERVAAAERQRREAEQRQQREAEERARRAAAVAPAFPPPAALAPERPAAAALRYARHPAVLSAGATLSLALIVGALLWPRTPPAPTLPADPAPAADASASPAPSTQPAAANLPVSASAATSAITGDSPQADRVPSPSTVAAEPGPSPATVPASAAAAAPASSTTAAPAQEVARNAAPTPASPPAATRPKSPGKPPASKPRVERPGTAPSAPRPAPSTAEPSAPLSSDQLAIRNMLADGRAAYERRDYKAAVSYAESILFFDPENQAAQKLLNDAERARARR